MFLKRSLILLVISTLIFLNTSCDLNSKKNKIRNNTDDKSISLSPDVLESEKDSTVKDEILLDSSLEDKYDLAYEKFHSGYYNESITICNEIIEKQKNHYKAYNIKGIALAFSDDFDNGMKNIDKSINLNDLYWYSRFNKALAYSYNKDFENGLIWYDKSLELNDYCWSYYGKAAIYGQLDDVDKAVENLKLAIGLNESVKSNAKYEKDFNLVKDEQQFKDLLD